MIEILNCKILGEVNVITAIISIAGSIAVTVAIASIIAFFMKVKRL